MPRARWKDLCLDATDTSTLGEFWGAILGLEVEHLDDGDVVLRGARPEETIWVNRVPEPKEVKHRVHLDVNVPAIDPLVDAGATVVLPASESGFPWTVLTDPEGGEFCAFVREVYERPSPAEPYELVVNVADSPRTRAAAAWWADVLGGEVGQDDEEGFAWVEAIPGMPWEGLVFVPVPEPKTTKNRVHWDITCDDVDGLLARGATVLAEPTDRTGWHVLADPDGNEFCAFPSS